MKIYLVIILSIFTLSCKAQSEAEYLSKAQIEKDLAIVDDILQNKSSYQGLNGYDYRVDFENYLNTVTDKKISQFDFGLFLSKTIGKIGDRHSFIKDYDIRDSLYLTLAFAPFKGKVLVVDFQRDIKEYKFWNSEFP